MPAAKYLASWCAAVLGLAAWLPANVSADPIAQARLLQAIAARDLQAATAALDAGADPNLAADFGRTPLHEAARESAEIVAALIERGAQVDPVDGAGRTPLHLAYSDAARVLLDRKADFLRLDNEGNTALHTAAEQSAETCRILRETGLPIDVRNRAGLTPLHFASLAAGQAAARYLLAQGADLNAKTLGPYRYKWIGIAWDVEGMEQDVPIGSTPLSIALDGHERTKWSSGRFRGYVDFLRTQGAAEPKSTPSRLVFMLASPLGFIVFFWLLFRVDAYLRDWTPLAERFAAATTPVQVATGQNGSVGRIGAIQLRKMMRVAVTDEGLYLAMPAWVVAAHPPLLIPWAELQVAACSRGLTGTHLKLRVQNPSVPIFLTDGVADQVLSRVDPTINCKGDA